MMIIVLIITIMNRTLTYYDHYRICLTTGSLLHPFHESGACGRVVFFFTTTHQYQETSFSSLIIKDDIKARYYCKAKAKQPQLRRVFFSLFTV